MGNKTTFNSEAARAAALKRWQNTSPDKRSEYASRASRAQTSAMKAKAGRAGWKSTCNRHGSEKAHEMRKAGSVNHQRLHPSSHEITVTKILKRHGVTFQHIADIDGFSYDFMLPECRAVLLVNGEVHRLFDVEEKAARQAQAIDAAHANGYAPLIVEYDSLEKDMQKVLEFCGIPYKAEQEEELVPF